MYNLIVIEAAQQELENASFRYDLKVKGLGARFAGVIKEKLKVIQEYPERSPIRRKNLREAIVRTFPYLIVYSVNKKENQILVTSIFHTKRNPKKKYRKAKW